MVSVSSAILDMARRGTGLEARYVRHLHPKQLEFFRDDSKRKAAVCSRRAGKSHAIGVWLLAGADEKPNEKSVYIALTRGKAKEILWDWCLEPLNRKYQIGLRLKHSEGQLYIAHPNGHRIWLMGVDNASEADKVRGERLYRAVVDEAQAFGEYCKSLVLEALAWALMDLDGQMALTGTPNATCSGYFWAITTGDDPEVASWPTHHWTVLDNPAIPHAEDWLAEFRAMNAWGEDHPSYLREGLGIWVLDEYALVYPFERTRNALTRLPEHSENPFGLPPGEWIYGLGVDLGFSESSTAFVLCAVPRGTGRAVLLRAYTRTKLVPTSLAAHVEQVRQEILDKTEKHLRVVVDEGALGKGYAEQMRVIGVGCEPAKKPHKRAFQEYVKGLILSGDLRVDYRECDELIDECKKLQFDPETGKEDDRYKNHCADAMLYIVRTMLPRYDPEKEGPKPGTPEAVNLAMKKRKEKRLKELQKKRNKGTS